MHRPQTTAISLAALTVWLVSAAAQPEPPTADTYRAAFEAAFPKVRTVEEGRQLVTAAAYDALMLENRLPGLLGLSDAGKTPEAWSQAYDYLKLHQDELTNENSAMAWGLSYDHLSLNQMARGSVDKKYLMASWLLARAVTDARDNVRGLALKTGEVAPIWGCSKYIEDGRAAHAVHTAMITFPVLEVLILLRDAPHFEDRPDSEAGNEVLKAMRQALEFHDRQWREGPADDEGYYIGMNQEPALEGICLPANRQAAMGRALWLAHVLTGNPAYRDKALRIGEYLKNRISLATDKNAYVWSYNLMPEDKAQAKPLLELVRDGLVGEDISHASLTASFPMLLYPQGLVFDAQDAERFANTVTEVFGREGEGVLYTHVDGMPRGEVNPGLLVLPGRWLSVAPNDQDVYKVLGEFLLTRNESLRPLDLANLLRYRLQPIETPPDSAAP